jgi:hypothetical protein
MKEEIGEFKEKCILDYRWTSLQEEGGDITAALFLHLQRGWSLCLPMMERNEGSKQIPSSLFIRTLILSRRFLDY